MRSWLLRFACLALLFAGCTSTGNVQPTLRGAIVPTRSMPSLTPTPLPTDTPTLTPTEAPTLTFTPTDTPQPTDTPAPTATDTVPPPTDTPQPTDTPAPTATDTVPPPTDTPQPTDTPEPTATDTVPPPTDTPDPTDTPAPTATDTEPPPTDTPDPTPTPTSTVGSSQVVEFRNSTSLEPVTILGDLPIDTVLSGRIDDEHPVILYTFNNTTPGLVSEIDLRAVEGDLDPFLIVLDPKGRELARNDNVDDEDPNSQIIPLPLLEVGTYVIVATRVDQDFGDTSGNYDVAITTTDPLAQPGGIFSQQITYGSTINGAINDDNPEQVYTFRGAQGDVITIQMTGTSGRLDPKLTVTNNLGTPLVSNDDNLLLDTLDSNIQGYILPRTGYYSIVASSYSDSAGNYRIKFTRDSQNATGIYAILDPDDSGTVKDDTGIYIDFASGDELEDNGTEHSLQALFTFQLPPQGDPSLTSAMLGLEPCVESGGGFAALGQLTIYQDAYGEFASTRAMTRPNPGARVVATQDSCDTVDLTSVVQEAYASGTERLQFRLLFRSRVNNDEADRIRFTPSLLLTFGE